MAQHGYDTRRQFLQPTIQAIHTVLGLPAAIWLLDETGTTLRIAAAVELFEEYVHNAYLRLDETCIAVDVFNTQKTVLVPDIAAEPRWKYRERTRNMGFISAIVAPLFVKKAIIGIIDVYIPDNVSFDLNERMPAIETFTAQIGATLRQVQGWEILNDVGRLISSEIEKSAGLFNRIMRSAQQVLKCKHASLFLKDNKGDLLMKATSLPTPKNRQFKPGEGLAGYVAQTAQSLLVPDVREHPQFVPGQTAPFPEERERSLLLVPIELEGNVIGVISADMDGLNGFDEQDQLLLEALASQAAVALHNAELFESEKQQKQRAEVLQEVARIVNSSLDRQNVCEAVLGQLRNVIEYDSASIQQIEGDRRILIAYKGLSTESFDPRLQRNISEDPLVSRIVQTRTPIVISDTDREETSWEHLPQTEHVKSWIGVPLLVQGKVIGLLTIDHAQKGYFTPLTGELAQAFANQVATALFNADLFQKVQSRLEERIKDVKMFEEVYETIEKNRLGDVLYLIIQECAQIAAANYVDIWLYDPDKQELSFDIEFEERRQQNFNLRGISHLNLRQTSIITHVATTKQPYYAIDVLQDAYYLKDINTDVRSELAVPLLYENTLIGVLNCESTRLDGFTEEHQKLLEALGGQAAIAIHNARLTQRLTEFNQRQKVLIELGQKLTSTILLTEDQILEAIYENASKLMHTQNMYIALYDEDTNIVRFGLVYDDGIHIDLKQGVEKTKKWEPRLVNEGGKTEWVIQQKNWLLFKTLSEVKNWHNQPGHQPHYGTKLESSWLGVPMVSGDKVLGVIATHHDSQEYVYNEDDAEILISMANQAAIALENARLYNTVEKQVQKRTVEWETANAQLKVEIAERERLQKLQLSLYKISETAHAVQNLTELFPKIRSIIGEFMYARNFYIALYNADTEILSFAYSVDEYDERTHVPRKLKKGLTEYVLKTKMPLLSSPEIRQKLIQEGKIEPFGTPSLSWLGVPLKSQNMVIGVLAVQSYTTGIEYGEQEKEILIFVSEQIASAIERVRANEQLQKQNHRKRILIDLGRQITANLRLEEHEIANLIYDNAAHLMPIENLYLALYDEKTAMLFPTIGIRNGQRVNLETVTEKLWQPRQKGQGMTEEVIHTQTPIFLQTQEQIRAWFARPGRLSYSETLDSCIVIVPIMVENKAIGVIGVYHPTHEYFYNADDLETLQELANLAAIALNNARIFRQSQEQLYQRIQDLRALQEVYGSIGKQATEIVLEFIVEKAAGLTSSDYGDIWLLDHHKQNLVFAVEYGSKRFSEKKPDPISLTQKSIVAKVANQGELHISNDVNLDPNYLKTIDDAQSELAVPLRISNEIIGVLDVESKHKNHYTENHQKLIQTLADQAAIAVNMARLTDELQRRSHQRRVLISLIEKLISKIEGTEDEIFQIIYDNATELMDTGNMYIALYNQPTDMVSFGIVYENGNKINLATDLRYKSRSGGKGKTEWIIRNKHAILHRTQEEAVGWYNHPDRKEYVGAVMPSWLGVPMLFGDTVLGVIATYPTHEYAYNEKDQEHLQFMASIAAIAINNSRLYKSIIQQQQQQQVLIKVGQELGSQIGFGEKKILELIYNETSKLMNTENMSIAIFDEKSHEVRFPLRVINGRQIDVPSRQAGRGRTEEIIRTGKPIIHHTKDETIAWYAERGIVRSPEKISTSWLGVPINTAEKVIGVIALYNFTDEYAYNENDAKIFQSLANQAAIALENTRMVSELRRMQNDIADRERELVMSGLAMDFAHKMNNLAGPIPPWIALIKRKLGGEGQKYPKVLEYLDNIGQDVSLILQEAYELRKPMNTPENVVVEEVIGSIVGQIEMMATPEIEIIFKAEPDLPCVYCVERQLAGAIYSVIQNATKAITGQGKIMIDLQQQKNETGQANMLQLRISDTGHGIAETQQESIFNYGTTYWPDKQGTGYGLWRCRNIIQSIGGRIELTRSIVGEGTIFTIFLPTVEA